MEEVFTGNDLKLLGHLIYELQKGIRYMALYTLRPREVQYATKKLAMSKINYVCVPVSPNTVNLFFGRQECLNIVGLFGNRPLNELTPEEDFMLGAMLGYDVCQQCERYGHRKSMYMRTLGIG